MPLQSTHISQIKPKQSENAAFQAVFKHLLVLHSSTETFQVSTEAFQVSTEAFQVSAEAFQVSAEAFQVSTEAFQVSTEAFLSEQINGSNKPKRKKQMHPNP